MTAPWIRIGVLMAAGVSAGVNVGKVPISLPALREAFGLDLVQSSFLMSALLVTTMLIGLIGGLLADRFGPRRCLLLGLGLAAAAGVAGALARAPAQLFVSRGLESVAYLATLLPVPALFLRIVPPSRMRFAMGLWACYMPVGMALAMLVAPALIALAGWPSVWAGNAVVSALIALLAWRLVPADAPAGQGDAPAGQGASAAPGASAPGWGQRVRATMGSAGPWLLAASFACYAGQWIGLFGFLPTLYAESGIDIATAGRLTALGIAANIGGNLAAGLLAERGIGRGWVLAGASLVMLACLLTVFTPGLPFAVQYPAVIVFSLVGGLVPGSLFATTPAFAPTPDAMSSTTGLMQQGSAVALFGTPPLLAAIVSAAGGWAAGLWLLGLLAVANVGIGLAIGRRLG